MSKFRSIKNSFLAGQIGGNALGRTDLQIYPHSCEELKNVLPLPNGGVYRRPGTMYVRGNVNSLTANYPISTGPVLLGWETTNDERFFVTSLDETSPGTNTAALYELTSYRSHTSGTLRVFGGQYTVGVGGVSIYADTQTAQSADVTYTANQYHPPAKIRKVSALPDEQEFTASAVSNELSVTGHGYTTNQPVTVRNTGGGLPAGLSANTYYYVIYVDANTFKLSTTVNGAAIDLTTAGTGTHYVCAASSYYAMYPMFGEGLNTDGGVSAANMRDSMPYLEVNDTSYACALSGTTLTFYVSDTSSTVAHILPDDLAGSYLKLKPLSDYGCVKLVAPSGGTVGGLYSAYTVQIIVATGSTDKTSNFWWGAWSDHFGWPRAVVFHQDRLCYGGTKTRPDSIWCSAVGNYSKFSKDSVLDPRDPGTGNEEEAFTIELLDPTVSKIQWLYSGSSGTLFAGTATNEYTIPLGTNGFSGVDRGAVRLESSYGSAYIQAQKAGNELIFVSGDGSILRALKFNNDEQSYTAENLQILFTDYPEFAYGYIKSFRKIKWDHSRSTLWCLDMSNNLATLTRDRDSNVNAWAIQELGGGGTVYDFAVVKDYQTNQNRVGFLVARPDVGKENDGSEWITLEVLHHNEAMPSTAYESATANFYSPFPMYVDCGKQFTSGGAQVYIADFMGKTFTANATTNEMTCNSHGFADNDPVVLQAGTTLPSGLSAGVTYYIYYVGANTFKLRESVDGVAIDITTAGTGTLKIMHTDHAVEGQFHREGYGLFAMPLTGIGASGYINIDSSFVAQGNNTVIYGFHYDSIIRPVRLEAGSQIGTAQGAIKRIHSTTLRFYKTMGCEVGRDADNLEQIVFRESSTPLNKSSELYTGDKEIKLDSDYDCDAYLYIRQSDPLPFCVLSVISEGMTYD